MRAARKQVAAVRGQLEPVAGGGELEVLDEFDAAAGGVWKGWGENGGWRTRNASTPPFPSASTHRYSSSLRSDRFFFSDSHCGMDLPEVTL